MSNAVASALLAASTALELSLRGASSLSLMTLLRQRLVDQPPYCLRPGRRIVLLGDPGIQASKSGRLEADPYEGSGLRRALFRVITS
ncbi:hypothetical protein NF552_03435 [Roseomonas mucosa]|nr:hypothetical protein NF552_03435 [Roseomonas mucosa]